MKWYGPANDGERSPYFIEIMMNENNMGQRSASVHATMVVMFFLAHGKSHKLIESNNEYHLITGSKTQSHHKHEISRMK